MSPAMMSLTSSYILPINMVKIVCILCAIYTAAAIYVSTREVNMDTITTAASSIITLMISTYILIYRMREDKKCTNTKWVYGGAGCRTWGEWFAGSESDGKKTKVNEEVPSSSWGEWWAGREVNEEVPYGPPEQSYFQKEWDKHTWQNVFGFDPYAQQPTEKERDMQREKDRAEGEAAMRREKNRADEDERKRKHEAQNARYSQITGDTSSEESEEESHSAAESSNEEYHEAAQADESHSAAESSKDEFHSEGSEAE